MAKKARVPARACGPRRRRRPPPRHPRRRDQGEAGDRFVVDEELADAHEQAGQRRAVRRRAVRAGGEDGRGRRSSIAWASGRLSGGRPLAARWRSCAKAPPGRGRAWGRDGVVVEAQGQRGGAAGLALDERIAVAGRASPCRRGGGGRRRRRRTVGEAEDDALLRDGGPRRRRRSETGKPRRLAASAASDGERARRCGSVGMP